MIIPTNFAEGIRRKGGHPLTIEGKNIFELAQSDPREAHRLVEKNVCPSTRRVFTEYHQRQSCIGEAMSKPLPGAAADAMINGCLKVNGRKIYEVVPTHIKCLQAVDSPILKLGQAALDDKNKSADGNFTDEEEWELCYIFTTPPRELRLLLKESGPTKLKAEAERLWADGSASASEITMTVYGAFNQYARHFQTTAKFEDEMTKSGDVSFFLQLKNAHLKPVASGG